MASTTSIVTTVDSSNWNGFLADDGAVARVREGQSAICTAFGNLSIPAGATIDGIEFIMEGYSTSTTFTNPFLSVSNDGGSSFSTARNIETAPFTTSSTEGDWQIEQAGGATELWGLSWTPTTANNIQFKIDFSVNSGGVFFDYVLARIYYTQGLTTYPSDDNMHIQNGVIVLNNGRLDIQ